MPDGRVINRTRRIKVFWRSLAGGTGGGGSTTSNSECIYLVLMAPRRAAPNASAHNRFLGRAWLTQEDKQGLMRSWIDTCARQHGKNCEEQHGSREDFIQLVEGTYFGVIDVRDMQLKPLPIVDREPARYVALSYVWGQQLAGSFVPYTTTRSNVMKRIGERGLDKAWDRLPRTIQDVFHLVRRLGERYLWIDSLCIVQDSISSWELNAKAMHLVYGHAHFTICAADGDAETGLMAVGRTLRSSAAGLHGSLTPSLRSGIGSGSRHSGSRTSSISGSGYPRRKVSSSSTSMAAADRQVRFFDMDEEQQASLTAELLPGIELLVSRPPESVIQDSVWSQRGWTFQERLLSRRCLVFAEGQVYFQCRTAVMSQDILNDGDDTNTWSLDWANSPLRTLGELRRKAFWFYMKCVGLYTGRRLTKPKDVLTAFQGTSWLLQKHLNAPLLYGLPTSHFDLALLWMPLGVLQRRKQRRLHWSRQSLCSQDELGNCNCKMEQEGYGGNEFPSWSWCGWMEGKVGYQLDMIHGCLLNVREWLTQHTWILWYIRDNEGNLRPLWDQDVLREDSSEEERWRGYRGVGEVVEHDGSSPRRSSVSARSSITDSTPRVEASGMLSHLTRAGVGAQHYLPSPPPVVIAEDSDGRPSGQNIRPRPPYMAHPPPLPGPPPPPPFYAQSRSVSTSGPLAVHRVAVGRPGRRRSPRVPRSVTNVSEWSKRSNEEYLNRLPADYYGEEEDEGADKIDETDKLSKNETTSRRPSARRDWDGDAISRGPSISKDVSASAPSLESREMENDQNIGRPSAERPRPRARSTYLDASRGNKIDTASSLKRRSGTTTYYHYSNDEPRERVRERDHQRDAHRGNDEREYPAIVEDGNDDDEEEDGFSDEEPGEDPYGRPLRDDLPDGTDFTGILPDHPFGVNRGPFRESHAGVADHQRSMPILQFFTWLTDLRVFVRAAKPAAEQNGKAKPATAPRRQAEVAGEAPSASNPPLAAATSNDAVAGAGSDDGSGSGSDAPHISPRGLVQCDIFDSSGDWCGAIVLPHEWIAEREGQALFFIAISEAKAMTMEECPVWNYYVPKEREESEWDIYYVMLLERDQERALWERKGLGKVFKAAFGRASWDEIKLG
jgi:hypothetical protein